jgi:murein DD-endopeptidase MepM/ murein hydrolase activator NlpD
VRKFFNFVSLICLVSFGLNACDLQPKIASIPDNIGMFIEDRYPALLADPETQPEIYNSAASDYGVYASPELYGSANVNDYVLYASVDDYVLKPTDEVVEISEKSDEKTVEPEPDYIVVPVYGGDFIKEATVVKEEPNKDFVIVAKGDTLYSIARKNNKTVSEIAKINNMKEPYNLSIGQKVLLRSANVKQEIPNVISTEKVAEIKQQTPVAHTTTKRVNLTEITVEKGDTLYSLSRKYEIPVNDLAVLNKLNAPFALSIGQKLKVPQLNKTVKSDKVITGPTKIAKTEKPVVKSTPVKKEVKTKESVVVKNEPKKISSDPQKQLPKITARSSAKFSWPVRGKILSQYGAKNGGLFNDGINISAPMGTVVKSAENGVVAYAGNEVKGMGNLIIVQHSDGWMTVYAHLDSMSVKRGSRVAVGQQIGKVGKTGKVDKPQLHFEIRKGTKAYNPTQYLKK